MIIIFKKINSTGVVPGMYTAVVLPLLVLSFLAFLVSSFLFFPFSFFAFFPFLSLSSNLFFVSFFHLTCVCRAYA